MKYRPIVFNKISLLEVDNENGLRIIFSPIGAGIKDIYFDDVKMDITPQSIKEYFDLNNTFGKTIENIDVNKLYIFDNKDYRKDERYLTSSYCFQGKPYMDKKIFSILYIFNKKKMVDGLPNDITYYISYSFNGQENVLYVDYKVMCNIPSEISLSPHILFNLGSEDINELSTTPNSISNDKYKIEISSSCDSISFKNESLEEKNGIYAEVKDSVNKIVNNKEIYNCQTTYKFTKL